MGLDEIRDNTAKEPSFFFHKYICACFYALVVRQVEGFFTKAVQDLGNKLAALDPTVPIRSIINERAEHAETTFDSHGSVGPEPWVMRGSICTIVCSNDLMI